jgi:hypothetical protein
MKYLCTGSCPLSEAGNNSGTENIPSDLWRINGWPHRALRTPRTLYSLYEQKTIFFCWQCDWLYSPVRSVRSVRGVCSALCARSLTQSLKKSSVFWSQKVKVDYHFKHRLPLLLSWNRRIQSILLHPQKRSFSATLIHILLISIWLFRIAGFCLQWTAQYSSSPRSR